MPRNVRSYTCATKWCWAKNNCWSVSFPLEKRRATEGRTLSRDTTPFYNAEALWKWWWWRVAAVLLISCFCEEGKWSIRAVVVMVVIDQEMDAIVALVPNDDEVLLQRENRTWKTFWKIYLCNNLSSVCGAWFVLNVGWCFIEQDTHVRGSVFEVWRESFVSTGKKHLLSSLSRLDPV